MDIDEFYLKTKNEFSLNQKLWFASLCWFNFYAPLHVIQVVFTGNVGKFKCTVGNETYNNSCGVYETCDSVVYAPELDSFIQEWASSPCKSYVSQIVQMSYTLGVLFGALTLGPVADRYGRKFVLMYSLMGMMCFSAAGSFARIFVCYLILRFLTGACAAGNVSSGFVLLSELTGPSYRGICGNIFQMFFGLGIAGIAGLGYLLDENWRILGLTASFIGVPLIFFAVWIPESPRWLYANGHVYKGRKVLERLTGSRLDDDIQILAPRKKRHGQSHPQQLTMCDMFRFKAGLVLVQMLSWFCNSFVYYAFTLGSSKFGGNKYVSTALSGFIELPALALTAVLVQKWGRRPPLVFFMVVAGVSLIILQFIAPSVAMYLGLLGKLAISGSFSIVYIYSSELFPTVVRTSGVGLCSSSARVGGVAASLFVSPNGDLKLQSISLGSIAIIAGLLNLTLPETRNKRLPESIEELNCNEVPNYSILLADDILGDNEDGGLKSMYVIHSSIIVPLQKRAQCCMWAFDFLFLQYFAISCSY